MFKELFRFKGSNNLDSIKKGLQEATGEPDFLGLEGKEDQATELEKMIKAGFIEFSGDEIVVNGDISK